MKIVFISSEIVPFASTGGLGDVCAALPKALAEQGVEIIRIMPCYRQVDREKYELTLCDTELHIPLGSTWYPGSVWKQQCDGVTTFFIYNAAFFDRAEIYGNPDRGYPDNFERFLFFQKAAVSLIDQWGLQPDVVHCNDWQTALIPMLLRHGIAGHFRGGKEKTLLTIHNLAHQGWAPAEKFFMTQLPRSCYTMHTLEFYGQINPLKGGLVAATALNAVSPNYAKEIMTAEFGCGLNTVLSHRKHVLHGILNGVDYTRWNPTTDSYIAANYSATDLSGKAECKRALQAAAGLSEDPTLPMLGMISRLVQQKGIDLLVETIELIMETGTQLVILGTGDEAYETACRKWKKRWPDQICSWIEFSNEKAHQIEAGVDIFLMPSEFEPCGQNQLYSLRYGTIPLVRAVGGLEDTVVDAGKKGGTGFKFYDHTAADFLQCLKRAFKMYRNETRWKALIQHAMQQDYSVVHMAKDYTALYERITSGHETVD